MALLAFAAAFSLVAPGCGSDEGGEGTSSTNKDEDTGGTIVDAGVTDPDTGTADPDTGAQSDIGSDHQDTATDASADAGGDDCPGGANCVCKSAKDCDLGFCINTPDGQRCARKCVDSCPTGFKCSTTTGSGGDTANICVPKWGNICDPCSENAQCKGVGNPDGACIDRGNQGNFCAASCTKDEECPKDYVCSKAKDVAGNEASMCVPKGGAACSCSAAAIKAQLSTTCFVASGSQKCPGKRTCLADGANGAPAGGGLSACKAPKPIAEVCDGADNDCDGDTDEGTCDDKNVCTLDSCGGAAGCKHDNAKSPCDADDSKCTVSDSCADGKCKPGKLLACDDGNACTEDSCDPKKGCVFAPKSQVPCNADDNPCTSGDTCDKGVCKSAGKKPCATDDFCVHGKCNITTGKCTYTPKVAVPCDDGNACTQQEVCTKEQCIGKAIKCDDGNTCTTDSCDAKTGCKHAPVAGPCDDANKCTHKDACKAGNCVGLAIDVTATCNDNNVCTDDSCTATKGCMNAALSGKKCEDGISCSQDDACNAGACKSGANICGCSADKDCAKHDDGDACNGSLYCDLTKLPYKCKTNPITVIKCADSGGFCRVNECNKKTGKCEQKSKPEGLPCDADNSKCTVADTCKSGVCAPGKVADCDDKNVCTNDVCDPKAGCKHTPNAANCDADGSACTLNDSCKSGACHPGAKANCDDGKACSQDTCDPKTGKCENTPTAKPCDDGNACTIGDACGKDAQGKATCVSGKQVPCGDGNACTFDSCDATKGCQYKKLADNAPCDDGNKCTLGDACKANTCQGTALDVTIHCDDKKPCTVDKCDSKAGCFHKAATNGSTCEDGDICTTPDVCAAGTCVAGKDTCACKKDADCSSKDDGNPCNGTVICDKSGAAPKCAVDPKTVVVCDPKNNTACSRNTCNSFSGKCSVNNLADGATCDADGSKCTPLDACSSGKCVAGKKLDCDDLNACTIDKCDPAKGCVYAPSAGKCDADNNACTLDVCKNAKCTATGQQATCNDNNACTADSCNKGSGTCVYTPLTKACDDGNKCTIGDKCALNTATGKQTCQGQGKATCDDKNPCTKDSCDTVKGCIYTVDAKAEFACWTGDPKKQDKGICKSGKQTCKADGSKGACVGEVKPKATETCNGSDDNCDGFVDEGCKPALATVNVGAGSVNGSVGGKAVLRTRVGANQAAAASNKYTVRVGWLAWVKALLGK